MRVTISSAMLGLLLASGGPVVAQAQPPQERINTALTRAREIGVPVSLLESKIAEGKAKGVPLERIADGIERREAALERATEALRGRPEIGAADLSVAADALESGMSETVLRAVADAAPRERRAVAIAVVTQLVELGEMPEAALDRVREALKRGPDALANLPAAAGSSDRRRGPPETPGSTRGRGGAAGGPPAGVPAPGGSAQPTRPGGPPPATPGGRPTGPGAGRGGG